MLMVAVAGLGLPAALILSDEMVTRGEQKQYVDKNGDGISDIVDGPTESMLGFSRFNAVIMVSGYIMYLLFQLGTHGEEFEDVEEECEMGGEIVNGDDAHDATRNRSRRNKFFARLFGFIDTFDDSASSEQLYERVSPYSCQNETEVELSEHPNGSQSNHSEPINGTTFTTTGNHRKIYSDSDIEQNGLEDSTVYSSNVSRKRTVPKETTPVITIQNPPPQDAPQPQFGSIRSSKSHSSDGCTEEEPTMIPVSEVQEQIEEGVLLLRC
jgi:hypothetical protein